MKNRFFLSFFLCAAFSIFLANSTESTANDSCSYSVQGSSTITGDIENLEDYHTQCPDDTYSFSISDNSGKTIAAGGSASIIVEGGIGPYTWVINSSGYSWESGSGVKIEQTTSEKVDNIIYCNSGT